MEPPHWSKQFDRYGVGIVCRSYYLVVLYFSIGNKLLVVFFRACPVAYSFERGNFVDHVENCSSKRQPMSLPITTVFPHYIEHDFAIFWEFVNSLHWLSHLVCPLLSFETHTILSNLKVSDG
jgi:hypothetical protein